MLSHSSADTGRCGLVLHTSPAQKTVNNSSHRLDTRYYDRISSPGDERKIRSKARQRAEQSRAYQSRTETDQRKKTPSPTLKSR
jgi:hypothetical protein